LEINYRYRILRRGEGIVQSKADTELVRRQNRGLVLSAVRRAGPLARVELGRETGLSPATISAITGDLLAEHILVTASIDERSERPLGRGRPRVALTLNDEAAYVLGVKVSLNTVTLLLSDYAGHLRDRSRYAIATMGPDSATFVPQLIEIIRGYRSRFRARRTRRQERCSGARRSPSTSGRFRGPSARRSASARR
jgi:hypothetical protein